MRKMLTVLLLFVSITICAQGDYVVKTTTKTTTVGSEEEQFTVNNFPYFAVCDFKAGQKFLMVVEEKYGFMPIFKSSANDREVSNNKFQYKILEFQGTEETSKDSYAGRTISTRFIFESEGEKYYYEVKNQAIGAICANPRAIINNLVFLGDVDIARELLVGKTLYSKVTTARIDDENSSGGSREVKIPLNLEVTVTDVGAGTRECPVKIIFEDREGNSYYHNLIFSKTNSGLSDRDMVGANKEKYFPNVFSFTDKDMKTTDNIRTKYIGRAIYPKRNLEVRKVGGSLEMLLRYTPLVVKDVTPDGASTMVTLQLADKKGNSYTTEANLKYDIFIRNEDYIDDMFGYGDLRKQYPGISEENWILLGKGEVKTGMSKDECRLSLGSPIQIVKNPNSRYESWFYHGRTLEFDESKLARIK